MKREFMDALAESRSALIWLSYIRVLVFATDHLHKGYAPITLTRMLLTKW